MAATLRNKIVDAEDFGQLREAGIRLFELLTGKVWTDYNYHDSGVTIMEACLYALTELAYKADQPLPSLLQGSGSSFVTAANSFYNRPVTFNDLSKLLIDIYGISNSWFVKQDMPQPPLYVNPVTGVINMTGGDLLPVKGLMEVYIELSSSELAINDPSLDFSDSELNGNILRSPAPASFSVMGGSEKYFAEFAFPYWESFPVEWQSPITIVSVTIPGGIPTGIVFNSGDDVFTTSLSIIYNGTHSFSFGVVIKMTPFYTKTVPIADLQTFIGNVLSDITPTGTIQRLNKKITTITGSILGVHKTLEENRMLGTVYSSVDAARMQEIAVKADILVSETINPEQLVTEIFLNANKYLSPLPVAYSEEELREMGYTTEEIFNGPLLKNGFLLNSSVLPLIGNEVIFSSDIIHAIGGDQSNILPSKDYKMLSFSFSSYLNNYIIAGPSGNLLNLPNSERYRPRLNIIKSDIRLFRDGNIQEILYDKNKVVTDFLMGSVRSIKRIKLNHEKEIDFNQIENAYPNSGYYSIQNDFPAAYGIGKGTLIKSSSPDRIAKSRQLKAYLMFFEQILADQDYQINNLPQILSLGTELSSMVPAQPLYNIPDVEHLLHSFLGSGMSFEDFMKDNSNSYITAIRNASESPEQFFLRRNRLLDHLLARFGEDLTSYTNLMLSKHFSDPVQTIPEKTSPQWKILQDKLRLLVEIGTLEGDRNLGPDFTKFIFLHEIKPGQWSWEILDPDNRSVLMRGNNILANALACFSELSTFISLIGNPACYVISAVAPFQVTFRILPPAGVINAQFSGTFATLPEAQVHIARIVELCGIIWNASNISGLEKKVARQIGFPHYTLHNLVDLSIDDLFVFHFDGVLFNFSATIDGFENPLISAISFPLLNTARTVADQVVKAAINPANYSFVTVGPLITIQISDLTGLLATIKLDNTPGFDVMKRIDELVVFFGRRFGSQEGFYMLEHIHLLPQSSSTTGLLNPVVFHANPYLYQVSVVIPNGTDPGLLLAAIPNRLTDSDYRIMLEKQFQKECPAHMLTFFIYPNSSGMSVFQQLFKRWRLLKHVINDGLAALEPIQSSLVQWLNTSNPKYPGFIN